MHFIIRIWYVFKGQFTLLLNGSFVNRPNGVVFSSVYKTTYILLNGSFVNRPNGVVFSSVYKTTYILLNGSFVNRPNGVVFSVKSSVKRIVPSVGSSV